VGDLPLADNTFHNEQLDAQIWADTVAGPREIRESGGTITLGFTPHSGL
jgi:hypothetical protein